MKAKFIKYYKSHYKDAPEIWKHLKIIFDVKEDTSKYECKDNEHNNCKNKHQICADNANNDIIKIQPVVDHNEGKDNSTTTVPNNDKMPEIFGDLIKQVRNNEPGIKEDGHDKSQQNGNNNEIKAHEEKDNHNVDREENRLVDQGNEQNIE
jgi:hypothetical protein